MTTEVTAAPATQIAKLEAATAEVEAATAQPSEAEDLVKALAEALGRLEKGGFGDTAKAHNGNDTDKSSPDGDGKPSGGYASGDAEEKVSEAAGRVSASAKVKTKTAAPPTELGKGATDEEEKEEDDEEGKTRKSQAATTTDAIYKGLATGDGAEEYQQVVEASDAIAHQTDVFAKGFAALSTQVAELSKEVHARIDKMEKSQRASLDASMVMLKSQAKVVADTELLKKTPATPASGLVHTVIASAATGTTTAPNGNLAKSIQKAMVDDRITVDVGSRLLAKLSSDTPDNVWKTLPETLKEAIGKE